jgi:TRAP-type mannitol/chloroaromatic compound transport system substrate-binding protein
MKNEFQKRFEEMAADINKFKKAEQEIENYKDEAQKQRKINTNNYQ